MLRDLKVDVSRINQVKNIYQVENQVAASAPIKHQEQDQESPIQQSESEAAHV